MELWSIRLLMKIKFWTYNSNSGDGSNHILFFSTEALAEAYAEFDDERNCDDINEHELEVDIATGQIIKENDMSKLLGSRYWTIDRPRTSQYDY